MPLEQADLPRAIEAAAAYYDENPEDLLHILALGAKAKAQTLLGELEAAEETLRQAAEVVTRSSPVPPFHASSYHRSRFLLDLAQLEAAGSVDRRHWVRQAGRSARRAMRVASKVAWRQTEVLRLAARYHALLGHRRSAQRLLARSAEVGERLGARPETARTYAEAARQLTVSPRAGERFRDLDAAACFARARVTFEQLGMTWDLERLTAS
jgi:hypothetical protein